MVPPGWDSVTEYSPEDLVIWRKVMVKKNSKIPGIPRIFTPPGPHDPVGNFLAEAGNIGAGKLLRTISSFLEKLPSGKTSPSPEEQYRRDSYSISLQKQQIELARAQTQ